jgi:hypothetical protein
MEGQPAMGMEAMHEATIDEGDKQHPARATTTS